MLGIIPNTSFCPPPLLSSNIHFFKNKNGAFSDTLQPHLYHLYLSSVSHLQHLYGQCLLNMLWTIPTECCRHLELWRSSWPLDYPCEPSPHGSTVPVWFWQLAGLSMVLHVRHNILQHLTAGPLLHAGELWRRVAGPLAVDDFCEQPFPEHGALLERGLLPEVGLVGTDLIPRDDRHLARKLSNNRHRASFNVPAQEYTSKSNTCTTMDAGHERRPRTLNAILS